MSDSLKRTALHGVHEQLGARFTDFGGWDMPLKYGKELDEHRAVRETVGVFDLSHMGEVEVTGPQAGEFLDYALISRLSAVEVGRAKYSMLCDEQGGILDDLITYRLGQDSFLVVPNAGNAPRVAEALKERAEGFDVEVKDLTSSTALVAIQGPRAAEVMHTIVDNVVEAPEASGATEDLAAAIDGLKYYAFFKGIVAGQPALIARTGYTGEDGFEIIVDNDAAVAVWDLALAKAQDCDGLPCGLASRDTLRLEAGMPLYGNELSDSLTPVDAGLGVLAATKSKAEFVGRDAILAAKEKGADRVLVGLQGEGRRAARSGYEVFAGEGDTSIGEVTSGALAPTLGYPVAMAYVDTAATAEGGPAALGATVEVDIRGKRYPYRVVDMPFYTRDK